MKIETYQETIQDPETTTSNPFNSSYSEEIETYQHFKKLDYWTLDEGLKLLIAPNEIDQKSESMFPSLFDIEFLTDRKKYQTVTRAINKSLTVEGDYKERKLKYRNSDIKKTVSNHWYYCYAYLKVKPFEFLDFIKKKTDFKIPSRLEFSKNNPSSGDSKYFWCSDYSKDGLTKSVKIENEKIDTPRETDNNDNVIQINFDDDKVKVSDELKIALQAWKAIYKTDEGLNEKYGHKRNIEKWLAKTYPKLSKSAVERICTVININKKGSTSPKR